VLAERDGKTVVVGCVYIYPATEPGPDAAVRSWVRAADARLDGPLHRAVTDWVREAWPFGSIEYAERAG
jgi:hypothetical protein